MYCDIETVKNDMFIINSKQQKPGSEYMHK